MDHEHELMNRQPPTQPRDRLSDHADSYVDMGQGRFRAYFEHCHKSMVEIPTHLILSLGEKPTEGIRARLECAICGFALALDLRPIRPNNEQ